MGQVDVGLHVGRRIGAIDGYCVFGDIDGLNDGLLEGTEVGSNVIVGNDDGAPV